MLSIDDVVYYIPDHKLDVLSSAEKLGITIPQAKAFSRIYGYGVASGKWSGADR